MATLFTTYQLQPKQPGNSGKNYQIQDSAPEDPSNQNATLSCSIKIIKNCFLQVCGNMFFTKYLQLQVCSKWFWLKNGRCGFVAARQLKIFIVATLRQKKCMADRLPQFCGCREIAFDGPAPILYKILLFN